MAEAHAKEDIAYKLNPKYKGVFRPNLSSNGPYNNCPTEMPMKKDDNDNITLETVVCSPLAILGKAGRYMSIDKGPIAVKRPKIRMR
jgi:hypothetical protein